MPEIVKDAFKKNVIGEVLSVKWEKEDGNYEANYLQNGIKSAALFDAKGNWLETEKAIEIKELPAEAGPPHCITHCQSRQRLAREGSACQPPWRRWKQLDWQDGTVPSSS